MKVQCPLQPLTNPNQQAKFLFMNVWSTLDAAVKLSRRQPWPELVPAFDISTPELPLPVVFASPHSGRCYPKKFQQLSRLDARSLRVSEDAWVDELFADAPLYGASLLRAHFPRAMLDANRAQNELDPEMYSDYCTPLSQGKNARVHAGLGVIPRIVSAGVPIYKNKIAYAEAVQRLHYLHTPYHEALSGLLHKSQQKAGRALLIDCHSMPSSCATYCPGGSADFVLGDGHGQTCNPTLVAHVENFLIASGYRVVRNTPYSGGYSTLLYGKPLQGIQALQIEINRRLYMDEKDLQKSEGFKKLRANMGKLCEAICRFV